MIHLSADGSETLEDALRIFVETAGDDEGRGERQDARRALEAELQEQARFAWLEPTSAKVREAAAYLETREAPGLTRACELLDELQHAAAALVNEISARHAGVAGGAR